MGTAGMITRSELLESQLPAPHKSTHPSGLNQAEQPRQTHPETVQAFNVAPAVQTYIDGLPATPERFKPIDYKNPSVSQSTSLHDPGDGLVHVLTCVACSVCPFSPPSLPIQSAQFARGDALPCMKLHMCPLIIHNIHRILEPHASDTTCTMSHTHILFYM